MIIKIYAYEDIKYWIQSDQTANVRGVLQDLHVANVWFYYWGSEPDHIQVEL